MFLTLLAHFLVIRLIIFEIYLHDVDSHQPKLDKSERAVSIQEYDCTRGPVDYGNVSPSSRRACVLANWRRTGPDREILRTSCNFSDTVNTAGSSVLTLLTWIRRVLLWSDCVAVLLFYRRNIMRVHTRTHGKAAMFFSQSRSSWSCFLYSLKNVIGVLGFLSSWIVCLPSDIFDHPVYICTWGKLCYFRINTTASLLVCGKPIRLFRQVHPSPHPNK